MGGTTEIRMPWLVVGSSLASAFASAMSTTLKKAGATRAARSTSAGSRLPASVSRCGWPAAWTTKTVAGFTLQKEWSHAAGSRR